MLHRDGLMLVIDKPAGLPVHRGPKGGANLEASFDGLRFGLPRPPVLAHRLDQRYLRLPRAGTPSQGHRLARPVVQARQDRQEPIGPWSRAALPRMKAPSTCRSAGSTPSAAGGEAGSGRADGRHQLEGAAAAAMASTWLALEPVTGRTHQLRVHSAATGWPIVGDNIYGNGPRFGEPTPASAFPRDRDSDFEEQGAGARGGAGAGAYAGAAAGRAGWNGE